MVTIAMPTYNRGYIIKRLFKVFKKPKYYLEQEEVLEFLKSCGNTFLL